MLPPFLNAIISMPVAAGAVISNASLTIFYLEHFQTVFE